METQDRIAELEKAIDDIDTASDQHRPDPAAPESVIGYVTTVREIVRRARGEQPSHRLPPIYADI